MPCVPYLTICILFIFVIINFQVSHKLVLPLNRVMVLRPLSSKDMDLLMLLLRVKTSFKCLLTMLCQCLQHNLQGVAEVASSSYKSQGWGYFGIIILGRCKINLFLWVGDGGCYQVLYVENNVLCSVLFCPHLAGGVPGCCEGVLLLSKKIKLLIIISFVPLPRDPCFCWGRVGEFLKPPSPPPHSQFPDPPLVKASGRPWQHTGTNRAMYV